MLRLTDHARRRYRERVNLPPSVLTELRPVKVPRRLAIDGLVHPRNGQTRVAISGERKADIAVTASAVLLVKKKRVVVTCWRLSVDMLATVMVWAITGEWLGRET